MVQFRSHHQAAQVAPIHLLLIDPTTPGLLAEEDLDVLRRNVRPGTLLEARSINNGPRTIQSSKDEEQAAAGVIELVGAEHQRYDAAIVCCTLDVGSSRVRQTLPVIGAGRASLGLAAALGGPFSIIVEMPDGIDEMEAFATAEGFADRLVSVRAAGIPIEELSSDLTRTAGAFAYEAECAVRDDSATTVVLGCTAATRAYEDIRQQLSDLPSPPRLIEPLRWAVLLAEATAIGISGAQVSRGQ